MRKKLSRRMPPVSTKWQKLVFNNSGVEQNKLNIQHLEKLYILGYSHKNASIKLAEFASAAEHGLLI